MYLRNKESLSFNWCLFSIKRVLILVRDRWIILKRWTKVNKKSISFIAKESSKRAPLGKTSYSLKWGLSFYIYIYIYIWEIEGDVFLRIRAGWIKGRSTSRVSCDNRIPIKLKENFNKNVIRQDLLHGTKCWVIKNKHIQKMSVTELRTFR